MFLFSKTSLSKLETCHPDLQKIFNEVIKQYDCTVIEGYRAPERQNQLYHLGQSKLKGGQSKHNKKPSLAVDVAPYPIRWNELERFYHFGGYVKAVANNLGITIRWGGDWDCDGEFADQTFFDLPHFELL